METSNTTDNLQLIMMSVQVMLDKLALQLERRKLIAENRKLQNIMAKWLDGYTFTDKAKSKPNSLMVSGHSSVPLVWNALETFYAMIALEASDAFH